MLYVNRDHLIDINAKRRDKRFPLCVFNAQSVSRPKREKNTEIVEFIGDDCIDTDIVFLTETWIPEKLW